MGGRNQRPSVHRPDLRGGRRHLTPGEALLLLHSSLCSEQTTIDALRTQEFDVHVISRSRGMLGKRLHARADMLRARDLIGQDETEDILIFSARRR
jgi:hypothetical protein